MHGSFSFLFSPAPGEIGAGEDGGFGEVEGLGEGAALGLLELGDDGGEGEAVLALPVVEGDGATCAGGGRAGDADGALGGGVVHGLGSFQR